MSLLQLSIDTCNTYCAVALSRGEGEVFDVLAEQSVDLGKGHAEFLIGQIQTLLEDHNFVPSQLNRVVATVGPGSFTGQRVGLSAARALAAALNIEAFGIGVLPALIFEARDKFSETNTMVAVMDARRDAVYLRIEHDHEITEDCLVPISEAAAMINKLPHQKSLVGSGTNLLAPLLDGKVAAMPLDFPSIKIIAALGHQANQENNVPKPVYLRAPDAKPQNTLLLARIAK